ncbi:MAG: hypothetical protein SGPRY_005204, partial [Prymnesium sp.]
MGEADEIDKTHRRRAFPSPNPSPNPSPSFGRLKSIRASTASAVSLGDGEVSAAKKPSGGNEANGRGRRGREGRGGEGREGRKGREGIFREESERARSGVQSNSAEVGGGGGGGVGGEWPSLPGSKRGVGSLGDSSSRR